jgi:capsid assembly protease
MTHFAQLAQRIFNRPLAIRPERAEIAVAALAERLGIVSIQGDRRMWDDDAFAPRREPPPPLANVAGVALIPVHGTLVSRLGGMEPDCGMTGYNQIRAKLMLALTDPAVRAVAFDVDSPGGEVDGCFDLVDAIHAARGTKPIWAICADHAYSAAYAIASAADRVTVPRTGGTGSVGVITMLVDMSAALKEAGITVHFVTHGARKAEEGRAQYQGVKPELLGRIQAEIDTVGELFVATVARNRGADAAAIRGLEAACLMGGDGVAAGLADDVMAPADAFAALLASLPQAA